MMNDNVRTRAKKLAALLCWLAVGWVVGLEVFASSMSIHETPLRYQVAMLFSGIPYGGWLAWKKLSVGIDLSLLWPPNLLGIALLIVGLVAYTVVGNVALYVGLAWELVQLLLASAGVRPLKAPWEKSDL